MNIKQALGLGMELSGFFFLSYLAHEPLSQRFGWDSNLTLTGLLATSLVVWTVHAFIYFERRS